MAMVGKIHWCVLVSLFAFCVVSKDCQDKQCGQEKEENDEQALLQAHKAVIQGLPINEHKLPQTDGACFWDSTDVHIETAEIVHNNLGGYGPGIDQSEIIRLKHAATTSDGKDVDLVIEAVGEYSPVDPSANGISKNFIQINIAAGPETEFKVSFVDSSITDSLSYVEVQRFEMTINDIDEKIGVKEKATVDGYENYFVVPGYEFGIEKAEGGGTLFTSTHRGKECDNPDRRHDDEGIACNGVSLIKRAVIFTFLKTSGFKLKYQADGKKGGRNFFLSGGNAVMCPKPKCQEECSSNLEDMCIYAGCAACDECLDDEDTDIIDDNGGGLETVPASCHIKSAITHMYLAEVVTNNLGGYGPEIDKPKEIRVKNAATLPDGTKLDIIITALGDGYLPKNPEMNGLAGDFIQLNLAQEHEAVLDIRFVDPNITDSLSYVKVPAFEFTLYDIDEGSSGGQESYSVDEYESYNALPGYEFKITEPESPDGKLWVSASEFGGACDNPINHLDMGDVTCQMGKKEITINKALRSVLFEFKNATGFKLTFKVGGNWNGKPATGARNVMLGGATPPLCLFL